MQAQDEGPDGPPGGQLDPGRVLGRVAAGSAGRAKAAGQQLRGAGHGNDLEPPPTGDRDGPGGGQRLAEGGRVDRGRGPGWCRRALQEREEVLGGGGGAEQVLGGGADQVAGGAVALGAGDPAQEGRRDPGRLALDQVGGGGHLVGHRDLGDLEQPAVAVGPAPPVVEGAHAGQPDGHVGLPEPPGPAEGVGDDHGHVVAVQLLDRGPQPGRRGVGVGGQQHQPVPAGVGRVDQGVRPDQAGAGSRR